MTAAAAEPRVEITGVMQRAEQSVNVSIKVVAYKLFYFLSKRLFEKSLWVFCPTSPTDTLLRELVE